jgi:preprotein translocase subunit YajC
MNMSSVTMALQGEPETAAPAPATTGAPRVPGAIGTGTQQPSGAPSGAPPGPAGGGGGGPGGGSFIWLLMLFLVVMVVMTSMTGRREKKRREAVMAALKKGDRVQTLGGIIGTIVELQDNEVVLRVDEVSNTRIRFARTAVQGVLREGKPGPGGEVEAKLSPQTSNV